MANVHKKNKKSKFNEVLFDAWCMETVTSFLTIIDLCRCVHLVCASWSQQRASWPAVGNIVKPVPALVEIISSCNPTRVQSVSWCFKSLDIDADGVRRFLARMEREFSQAVTLNLYFFMALLLDPFPFPSWERLAVLNLCVHVDTPSWFRRLEPRPHDSVWPDLPNLRHLHLVGQAGGRSIDNSRKYFFLHLVLPALNATRGLKTIEIVHDLFLDRQTEFEGQAARLIEERHHGLDHLMLAFDPQGCYPRVCCRVLQLGSDASSFDNNVRSVELRRKFIREGGWTHFTGREIFERIGAQEVVLWDCCYWINDLSLATPTKFTIVDTKQSVKMQLNMVSASQKFFAGMKFTLGAVDLGRLLVHPHTIWQFGLCSKLQEARIKLQCDAYRGTYECGCRETFAAWVHVTASVEQLRTLIVTKDSQYCITSFDFACRLRTLRKIHKVNEELDVKGDLVLRLN